jgi:predicted aldo/keto reductase-like oxidoreductase
MQYVRFKDEVELSRLGMGNMRFPTVGGVPGAPIDREKAQGIIDQVVACGVNYFDTAYFYHNSESEPFLGDALAGYPRDSYCLADKYSLPANPDYRVVFEEQLKRLKTDRIDFYLLHGIMDHLADEYLTNGCVEYLMEEKRAGRIRYLGFSFHGSPETLLRVADHHPWDFAQIQLNYYDWMYNTAKRQYEILTDRGIPIMVMEPVHGGQLASLTPEANALLETAMPGRSIASWAMRWLMRLTNVAVVLSGMSDLHQVEDNVRSFSEYAPLSDAESDLLMKACALYRSSVAVPCTSCRYCVSDCPAGLNIPRLLSVYNEYKFDGAWRTATLRDLPEDKQPSACIGCGACASHCPQGFDIPNLLSELAEVMKQ